MYRIASAAIVIMILMTLVVSASQTEGVTSYNRETMSAAVKIITSANGRQLSAEQLSALYALGLNDSDISTLVELALSESEQRPGIKSIAAVCILTASFIGCVFFTVFRMRKEKKT